MSVIALQDMRIGTARETGMGIVTETGGTGTGIANVTAVDAYKV